MRTAVVGGWTTGHAVVADRLLAVGTDRVAEMRMRMTLLHEMSRVTRVLGLRVAVASAGVSKVVLVGSTILWARQGM